MKAINLILIIVFFLASQIYAHDNRTPLNSSTTVRDGLNLKTAASPQLSIISPGPGDIWFTGSSQAIIWNDNIAENVQIDLYKAGAFNSTIAATELSDGSLTLNIPGGTAASILDTHLLTITVTSPNGGESWQAGTAHPITWIDNIAENVIIELFKGGAFNSTIAATELSDGSFTWNIPGGTAAASDYTVVITSVNTGSITDVSDANFMITAPSDSYATPPPNMVAWWHLDEKTGTTAEDIAGFVNNVGNYRDNPIPVPGKVAGGLYFDGVDDYVEVAHQSELDFVRGWRFLNRCLDQSSA